MRRVCLGVLAVCAAVVLVSSVWEHPVSGWSLLIAAGLFPVALAGAAADRHRRLAPVLVLLLIVIEAGLIGAVTLGGARGTVWAVLVLGPAVLVISALGFAVTFEGERRP